MILWKSKGLVEGGTGCQLPHEANATFVTNFYNNDIANTLQTKKKPNNPAQQQSITPTNTKK